MKILWHYGGRGSWCHEIVEYITQGSEHHVGFQPLEKAIVVIKADAVSSIEKLDADLSEIISGVLIVTGNEEGMFDTAKITHPRIKVWLQTPAPTQMCYRALPWGWSPQCKRLYLDRPLNWSFAGQNTHARRNECIAALRLIRQRKADGLLYETSKFASGLNPALYSQMLSSSKLIPCPSGPITVDTFRVCEALECGAIPLVDTVSPGPYGPYGPYGSYWYRVFGERIPFPFIYDWAKLPEVMDEWLTDWDDRAEVVQAWWKAKKGEWIHQLAEDCQ